MEIVYTFNVTQPYLEVTKLAGYTTLINRLTRGLEATQSTYKITLPNGINIYARNNDYCERFLTLVNKFLKL